MDMIFPRLKPRRFSNSSPNNSVKSQSVLPILGWLLITILIQALIISFWIRDSSRTRPSTKTSVLFFRDQVCENGKIFVYDLPPVFNADLLENCHDLDAWQNRCPAVSNGGFGPKSPNIAGVVPRNLTPAWYQTDTYTAEVIYHSRILSYKCRTTNPDEATAFFVPFYAGLATKRYFSSNYTAQDRDRPGEMLLEWLSNQPFWRKRNGADHFLVLGRVTWDFRRFSGGDPNWGARFTDAPLMKNVLKVLMERLPWEELEFSVPYPTAFHPRSESDIVEWQRYIRAKKRHNLFSFVGSSNSNDFRGLLSNQCRSESGSCKFVDCSSSECSGGSPAILEAYLDSDFCLQPRGGGVTRRSFFDCMVAGSIPVYFLHQSFNGQYEWHLPLKAESYSVFIEEKDVSSGQVSIKTKLEEYSEEEVRKMRETVIEFLPRILYAESSKGLGNVKDAFEITMERVLKKVIWDLRKKQSALL